MREQRPLRGSVPKADLAAIIASLAPGDTDDDPLALALDRVIEGTRAVSAAVFMLDLRTSRLSCALRRGDSSFYSQWPNTIDPAALAEPRAGAPTLSVPIMRRGTVIASISAQARDHDLFSERDVNFIRAVGGTASVVYGQKYLLELIEEAQTPVDYTRQPDEFYVDLEQIVKRASRTPAGALREYDGQYLKPVISWGTGDAQLDIEVSKVPEFEQALATGRSQILEDLSPKSLGGLLANPPLDLVQSAVLVPVQVGTRAWGVISFAVHQKYAFSRQEVAGLEMIANGVGVSIENYRNYQRAESDREEFREASAALTANDLVQMARHETRDLLGTARTDLVLIRRTLRGQRLTQSASSAIQASTTQIDQNLTDIATVLDRMKVASEPPSDELKLVGLRDLWTDVLTHVERSLRRLEITPKLPQTNPNVYVYRDWLRHALLNLVLNSMDAYRNRKRGGEIGLVLETKPQAGEVELTYYDHAGGLDRAFFRTSRVYRGRDDLHRLIFEPRVTSKSGGSGFGLYFVQRIISQDHKGSIELIDDKPGATFRITLPLNLHEREKRPS
jgi:signal transduction histidine kinase